MSRVSVPWVNGTSVLAAPPDVPPVDTSAERCAEKTHQIREDIAMLERHLDAATNDDARLLLSSQLAFQQRRHAWLDEIARATPKALATRARELSEQIGPAGLLAIRDGLALGVSPETLDQTAHLALVHYATGVR